ncbi:MAG: RNA-binding S4 domain-containing protein [Bacteroidia bacterium]|nr:RNA-binding S4 domain-containing protein [Bacteroidia bacterium]NNM22589.1 RNA-binding S4 domain-containing protein [Flavobacteriaceae bacterium]
MRIDKYLWCTRYFKTRNIATKACKKGAIRVNGDIVKPSRDIFPGDSITVRRDQVHYQLEVIDLPTNRVGAKLVNLYRTDTTPKESLENLQFLKLAKDHYRKRGAGRPTKKDRRDLEDFADDLDDDL